MIPEPGAIRVALAMCLARAQAILPSRRAAYNAMGWRLRVPRHRAVVFVMIASAVSPTRSTNEVLSIRATTRTQRPLEYRVAAVVGCHEGSISVAAHACAVGTAQRFSRRLPRDDRTRTGVWDSRGRLLA